MAKFPKASFTAVVAAVHLDEIAVVQQGDGRPISGGEEGMLRASCVVLHAKPCGVTR
jgi:hypothetical protein